MPAKLRIPFVVDLTVVDSATRMVALDARPQVTRAPQRASGLFGSWLSGRLARRLRVGGTMLPTFVDREDPARAALVEDLTTRLAAVDFDALAFRSDVAELASYVAGGAGVPFEVLAQQVVGRCFDPGFRASKASYRDARLIARWAAAASPAALAAQLTGALDRARTRTWKLCRQDRAMVHGTVLALPNVVDALARMRALFAKRPGDDVHAMLEKCLTGPPRLVRFARGPVEAGGGSVAVRAGGVVIYDLEAARRGAPGLDPFLRGRWNQCPAHALVPRLLGTIWQRAQRDRRRPTTLRFAQRGPARTLDDDARAGLTPGNLQTLAQWELDQLYAHLEAGPMPDGPYRGRFFFPEGIGLRSFAEAAPGLGVERAGRRLRQVEQLGGLLWKGKVFFPREGLLRNVIEDAEPVARLFGVHPAALRRAEIDGRQVALMFPARLGYGPSLSDPTRKSIIIDYDDAARLDGYLPKVDFLASRAGLRIRDEIRRIRPGLYLGYAYTDQRLLLMFTLYSAEAEAAAEVARARDAGRAAHWGGGGGQHGPHPSAPTE